MDTIVLNGITYNLVPVENEVNSEEIKSDVVEEVEVKLNGWERVESDDKYFVITEKFETDSEYENLTAYDDDYYNDNNYFSTEERAKEMADKIKLLLKLTKWRDENDIEGRVGNYIIVGGLYGDNICGIEDVDNVSPFDVTFSTYENAETALEIFGDDIGKAMMYD